MKDTQGLTGRALGEAVIDHVLSFPEQHDQRSSACGSTGCIAGWALALHFNLEGGENFGRRFWSLFRGLPGSYLTTSEPAAELLGVDHDEFYEAVFDEMDRDKAITNLKHLLDAAEVAS